MVYSVPPAEFSTVHDVLNAESVTHLSESPATIASHSTVSTSAADLGASHRPEAFGIEMSSSLSTLITQTAPSSLEQEEFPPQAPSPSPSISTFISAQAPAHPSEPTEPQSIAIPIPVISPPESALQVEGTSSEPPAPSTPVLDETFILQDIQVVGSTVLSDVDLEPITQPLIGRSVTLAELQAATDAITQIYLNQGYLTSRALDPEVTNGIAQIQVVEGGVERIEIQGAERIHEGYIRDRIQRAARTPLNSNRLENQLRLLRLNPLFENVEASLRAGDRFGQSIVVVRVTEANSFTGNVGIANDSPPNVGSEQMQLNLAHRNLTGNGDALNGFYRHSTTGGLENYGLNYQIPLNAREGTLYVAAERNRNEITQEPFDQLGIRGANTRYELSFRQPIVRSPQEEFALSIGFVVQDGQTFLFDNIPFPFGAGVEADGVSRTRVLQFAQDYIRRDRQGAWALRSQLNLGTELFNATSNSGSLPDGQFISWLGQAQRVQVLNDDHLLVVQADLQFTPDALLPSQQFALGGGQSVRGYRQNARSGDNGFRLSVEDRITLQRDESGNSTLQIIPFAEMGSIWNTSSNPISTEDNFLAGIGAGLLWNPTPNLTLRLDYGLPLVTIRDRGSNAQDNGLYFRVNYQF